MKRLLKLLLVSGVLIASLLAITYQSTLEKLSLDIGFDVTQGKLISIKQEGFVDIETFAKIDYPVYEMNKVLNNGEWKECPMESSLRENLNENVYNEISFQSGYYKYIENSGFMIKLLAYDVNKEILYYYCIE